MKKILTSLVILAVVLAGAVTLAGVAEAQGRGGNRWGAQGQGAGPRGPNYTNCPYYQANQTCAGLGPRWNQGGGWNSPRRGLGQTPQTTPTPQTPAPQSGN
jgi:hypothetical protein